MPILDIQKRFRELGRIRTGHQVATGNTIKKGPRAGQASTRPEKLPRFRLTSPWRHLIDDAADAFGGEVKPWPNPGTGAEEFEVYLETELLPILLPPGVDILDQWYERWSGGGLLNRCDGVRQTLQDKPCRCPADHEARSAAASKNPPEACKPTTRLKVMLPDVSDVGIWRLESHGFHAAAELGGAAMLLEIATRQGTMVPAHLGLALREGSRRPDQPRKKFYVPSIILPNALGPTLEALGMGSEDGTPVVLSGVQPRPALDAGGQAVLPAASTPFDPRPPVEVGSLPIAPPPPPEPAAPPEPDELPEPGPALDVGEVNAPPAAPPLPDPDSSFEPPERTPEPGPGGEPAFSGPQVVSMKLQDRGVKKRDEKIRIVSAMVGRTVASSKELTPPELRSVLDRLADPTYALPELESPEQAPKPPDPPAPPGVSAPDEVLRGEVVEPSASPRGASDDLDILEAPTWTPEQWRSYLSAAGVKVLELFGEARKIGRKIEETPPTKLEELTSASVSMVGLLLSFVEDLRETRTPS